MKQCLLCHTHNEDSADTCVACGEATFRDMKGKSERPAKEREAPKKSRGKFKRKSKGEGE